MVSGQKLHSVACSVQCAVCSVSKTCAEHYECPGVSTGLVLALALWCALCSKTCAEHYQCPGVSPVCSVQHAVCSMQCVVCAHCSV